MKNQHPVARIAYSVREVAQMLGVSAHLVYEEVRTHRIASVRIGGRIVIPHWAVEQRVIGIAGLPEPVVDGPLNGPSGS